MDNLVAIKNRRQFTRVLFSIPAKVEIDNITYPVSIHDISLNGALVTTMESQHPLKGKLGVLHFFLSDNVSEVTMDVSVVHIEDNETGLQCNAIDIDSISHLRRLIELNLGDSNQLNKELNQLSRLI
jgi:hypothetical protein